MTHLQLRQFLLLVHVILRKHNLSLGHRKINAVLSLSDECDGIIGRAVSIDSAAFDFCDCNGIICSMSVESLIAGSIHVLNNMHFAGQSPGTSSVWLRFSERLAT